MWKKKTGLAAVLIGAMILGGCGSTGENLAAKEYKASEYVTLGEYTGIAVNQIEEKKELTDDEKEEAIQEMLENDGTENEITDRGAEEGDYLSITYTCTQNGEVVDETGDSDVDMQLGQYEYFDEDGEKELIGTKAGDTRTITVSEEDGDSADAYVYEVNVNRVYTYDVPELTDAYAKEQGYDSAEDMRKEVLDEALQSDNDEYVEAAKDDLVQTVVNNCEINGYPQDLYDQTKEQLETSYQELLGMSLSDAFANSEEDVKAVVEEMLKQELVVEAVAEKANLTVSKKDLDEYKASVVVQYGYDDVSALEEEFDDATLAESLLNEKVRDYLYSKAKVTYVTEDEYYAAADEDDETDSEIVSDEVVSDDSDVVESEADLSSDIVDSLVEEPEA